MKLMRTCGLVLMVAVGLAAAGPKEQGTGIFRQESFADFSRPGLLRTHIQWGQVHVTAHDGTDVLVQAEVIQDRSAARQLTEAEVLERIRLELVEWDNVMDLVVDSQLEGFFGVNLHIQVPRSTSLTLEILRGGDVFVAGVEGEVDVSNRNGSVSLKELGGAAVVDAQNGSIVASFARVDPQLPMSFATLNGSVDVTFPPETAANLYIRYSRGGVESDFPIVDAGGEAVMTAVEGLKDRATRVVQGFIQGGGPAYSFRTANGTVYLRRG